MDEKSRLGVALGVCWMLVACAGEHRRMLPAVDTSAGAGAGNVGAKAVAKLEPLAPAAIGGVMDAVVPVSGTATFTQMAAGVDLVVSLATCRNGGNFIARIEDGVSCAEALLQARSWDATRGEGIPALSCWGVSGADVFYSRPAVADKPWSIGEPASSNVVGHALVVRDSGSRQPVACGMIAQAQPVQPADAGTPDSVTPRAEIRGVIAGLCISKAIIRTSTRECPNPEEFAQCANSHCELASCLRDCADYTACLEGEADPCASGCPLSPACAQCTSQVGQCALGHCMDMLFCAAPTTPGGPCSKLADCCMLQGDRANGCLDAVLLISRLSGDPSCVGLMHDSDFNTNFAYDPPCNFEAGM